MIDIEYISLRCQNGTLKNGCRECRNYLPYIVTAQKVTILAIVLKIEYISTINKIL